MSTDNWVGYKSYPLTNSFIKLLVNLLTYYYYRCYKNIITNRIRVVCFRKWFFKT